KMRHFASCWGCLLLLSCTLAGQDRTKPDLSGTWRLNAAESEIHTGRWTTATWVISEKDRNIHITTTETGKDDRKIDLECTTDGKECPISGEKMKASFWYNGPMLVEFETRGDNATRYQMKLSPDGNGLTVAVTYMVPHLDKPD